MISIAFNYMIRLQIRQDEIMTEITWPIEDYTAAVVAAWLCSVSKISLVLRPWALLSVHRTGYRNISSTEQKAIILCFLKEESFFGGHPRGQFSFKF